MDYGNLWESPMTKDKNIRYISILWNEMMWHISLIN